MRKASLQWMLLLGAVFIVPKFLSYSEEDPDASDSALLESAPDEIVDYSLYGTFENPGVTGQYRYVITDRVGLARAVGAGIYPNSSGLYRDLEYRKAMKQKKLDGPLENFQPDLDPQLAFFKWGSLNGTPYQGLRLYNVAQALELIGESKRALKAYYAAVVHFPKEISWQAGRPWYVGVAALDAVRRLVETHPEWQLTLVNAKIEIENGFDIKATNDSFTINPGQWVKNDKKKDAPVAFGDIIQRRLRGGVRFIQSENGHWQLLVDNQPYLLRGICYSPAPVGRSPDLDGYKPHEDWMNSDENQNGRIDGPYDAFVDINGNGNRDRREPIIGDFELMRQMGANTLRLYHHAENKELLRDLYYRYGMRVMVGDLLGAYGVGSGASWDVGTDYTNPKQRAKMRHSVWTMVSEHRQEPYVLMWVLGNENNYGYGNNANKNPVEFYEFVNMLARMIHTTDPGHPVALSNGDLENLELIAEHCPDIDVLAINAYRGPHGMGESFWENLQRVWDKPVIIAEFGAPAYNTVQSTQAALNSQANYLVSNWNDIAGHSYGHKTGNAIGGAIFEWTDEWWKSGPQYEAWIHDTAPQGKGPFVGGQMYEEWLGITSQGDGERSPYLRQLRPAYRQFKEGPWKEPMSFNMGLDTVWQH